MPQQQMQKDPTYKGWFLFFCGICMGAADLVPGISGGTIAFIMGFYHPLLESIKTLNIDNFKLLLRGQFRIFFQRVAWPFLITLLAGMCVSFLTLSYLIHSILEHEVYRIYFYSIFLGLIVASFGFCMNQIKKWGFNLMAGLWVGVAIAYVLTGPLLFPKSSQGEYALKIELSDSGFLLTNYDSHLKLLKHLSSSTLGGMVSKNVISLQTEVYDAEGRRMGNVEDFIEPYQGIKLDVWLILCGALAICALLLPGISGSYILTLLGTYPLIIGALSDLTIGLTSFSFDGEAFYILLNLGLGIGTGLLLFTRLISWLLNHYHDLTLSLLAGFMLGAMRTVWPFWSYQYAISPLRLERGVQLELLEPYLPSLNHPIFYQAIPFFIAGMALIYVLQRKSPIDRVLKKIQSS